MEKIKSLSQIPKEKLWGTVRGRGFLKRRGSDQRQLPNKNKKFVEMVPKRRECYLPKKGRTQRQKKLCKGANSKYLTQEVEIQFA
jgi:hypothetical protein